ncbi:glycosyl hydrolase [Kineosporia sp. NBRC 101677]|uniref:glycoside hydrolase family 26 protein n=1 Tax=Kineosporia sp. NBRC 101677 TaxID=3032197 RepID=UPI0025539476|nr:glycosyl hydrolase [Kineosporia sp. NBRC 101677]
MIAESLGSGSEAEGGVSRRSRADARREQPQPGARRAEARPGSRRARREQENTERTARGRHLQLPQIAAAALGVLAVLGGVVVAVDKIPGDGQENTAAMTSTTAVSELPSVSMHATPSAAASALDAETQSARNPTNLGRAPALDQMVDKEKLARAAQKAAAAKEAEKAAQKKAADSADSAGRPRTVGAAGAVKVGVFRGTSAAEVQKFGEWLGRDVDYAMDFSTRTSWDEIANPHYMLEAWKGSGYRMVYATAMLPTQDMSATMAAGARGEYDEHFRTLAQNLVAAGQGDSIIRLGWEFNLSASRWHPDTKENFIGYWRHIVDAMRSVPGTENLQFDWNPNIGGETYDSRLYYPGNKYVDYVGVDIYDISWAPGAYPFPADCDEACKLQRRKAAWNDKLNGTFGLKTWADFARSKGKPITLPEWGLWERPDGHGGGDNPYYIEQMYKFINDPDNNVAYQAYFEYDVGDNGNHALSTHTASGNTFKELLGK